MATAPTFVASYAPSGGITTGTSRSASVTTAIGDVLVLWAEVSDSGATLSTPTGGTGLTWTLKTSITGFGSFSNLYIWTATATAVNTGATISVAASSNLYSWYFEVSRFSGASGVGAASSTHVTSGAPTLNITTTADDSTVLVANADWNAASGSSRTWRTGAGTLTELFYAQRSTPTTLTGYAGYHADAGTAGTKAVGLSAPSGQKYSIGAVEILAIPFTTWNASATFAGAGAMTADGRDVKPASGTLAGAGSMTAGANSTQHVAASLAGAGSMVSDGRRAQPGAFTASGALALSAGAVRERPILATFAGVGSLTAVAADAFLAGAGSMVAGAHSTQFVAATFAGAGALTDDGRRVRPATITLAGAGLLGASPTRVRPALVTFAGAGLLVATAVRVRPGSATLSGAGLMTIDGTHLGPLLGTWVSPAKALPESPIDGSRVVWDATLNKGNGIIVATSIDNGATYQAVSNGGSVPGLIRESITQAVLTKVTLTRAWGADPTPRLHQLEIFVAIDGTRDEWVPLGVFTINETDITDGPNGVEISLSGYDLSQKLRRNGWEKIYTIDADTNLGDVIKQVISNRVPGATFNFASTSVTAENQLVFGAQGNSDPLSDCLDVAEKCGMELFLDYDGVWKMQPEPDPEFDPPVWELSDSANPTMTEVSRRLTDDDVANYIIVTGESSSDAEPAYGFAIDNDPTSPTYYQGPIGQVVKRITSPLVKDDDQATLVAQAQLRRRKGGTEIVEIDAVPAAFLRGSDIIRVTRDKSKLADDVLIDSVSMPLGPEDGMHLVTRRQRVADGRAIGGGVGGLNGDDGGDGGGGGGGDFTPDSFTFAFSSCSNRAVDGNDDSTAYTAIKNTNPTYFAHLGDMWYDDGSSNHQSHWAAAMAEPKFAALIASLPNPMIVNWSDHDATFANNGYAGSAANAGNAAYREQFPDLELPSNGIYRTWTRGRIRFILLDCITFKSAEGTSTSSSRTMLGSTQKAWLKGLVASSDYPMIVMLGDSQWPGPVEDGQDEWRGYDHERQEMASSFNASPATLIYLNGDTHSLAYGHDQFGLNRLWQASPLKNNTKVKAAGAGYVASYPSNADEGPVAHQYGIIAFSDNGTSISATCRFYGDGSLRLTDSVSVSAPV